MPRIRLKKKEYMKRDMSAWIVAQASIRKISNQELADILHIHRNTITRKLDNASFDYEELVTLFEYFDTPEHEIALLMKGEK